MEVNGEKTNISYRQAPPVVFLLFITDALHHFTLTPCSFLYLFIIFRQLIQKCFVPDTDHNYLRDLTSFHKGKVSNFLNNLIPCNLSNRITISFTKVKRYSCMKESKFFLNPRQILFNFPP